MGFSWFFHPCGYRDGFFNFKPKKLQKGSVFALDVRQACGEPQLDSKKEF
jgi:hypothetical protein